MKIVEVLKVTCSDGGQTHMLGSVPVTLRLHSPLDVVIVNAALAGSARISCGSVFLGQVRS